MIEKTGENQTLVFRDVTKKLKMRLPNDSTIIDYDGRFGSIDDAVNEQVFPEEG